MRTRRQAHMLENTAAEPNTNDIVTEPSASLESNQEFEDRSISTNPRKKRALEAASATQVTKSASSRRKGRLSGVLSLPVEIFTEIATHLTPPDLITLCRLAKGFRNLLMRRSAAPVWASAIRNVPGLPGCPGDMCEAQYAALVFSKHCSMCGVSVTKRMDPYLNVRLCNTCRGEHVISTEEAPNKLIKKLVPQTIGTEDSEPLCLRSDLEELSSYDLYRETPDGSIHPEVKEWLQRKTDFRIARLQYARNLEAFLEKILDDRSKELEMLKSQRRDDIKQRMESLGWNKRDWIFPMGVADKWAKLVEAPKPLTERGKLWQSLYPKLVPYLEENRETHMKQAPNDRYRRRERRLRMLLVGMKRKDTVFKVKRSVIQAQSSGSTTPHNEGFLSPQGDQSGEDSEDDWEFSYHNPPSTFVLRRPFPAMVEAFNLPPISGVLEEDVEAAALQVKFDKARGEVEAAIRSWRVNTEDELFRVFRAGINATPSSQLQLNFQLPPKYANALSALSPELHTLLRADTVFRFSDGRTCPPPLYYPEMFLIYQERRYGYFPTKYGFPNELGYAWKTSRVEYYEEGVTAAKAILNELGRQDGAQFELQALGAIFSCGQCTDKVARTWDQIVHHHAKALGRSRAYDQCTNSIKSSIAYSDLHTVGSSPRPKGKGKPLVVVHTTEEAQAILTKAQDAKSFVRCSLCSSLGVSFVGTRPVVLKHAKAVHSITNPKAEVYTVADQEDPDRHYLPRSWERNSESSGETDTPKDNDLAYRFEQCGTAAYWTDPNQLSQQQKPFE
ncbi:hypothetical protein FRC07_005947 [Ceratobasidium sp. 392]|nr:hypothetical protein FRC07_005947 [Ceratobasidium sp. 392]